MTSAAHRKTDTSDQDSNARQQRRTACGVEGAPACTLVIFGGAGDLTKRLLIPSLYDLAGAHLLKDEFRVIGVDHNDSDDGAWRADLATQMKSFTTDPAAEFYVPSIDAQTWQWLSARLAYLHADFNGPDIYRSLAARLKGNAIFYLATADDFFGPIIEHLGQAGLLKQGDGAFRRVIIEKPFGRDLASARALNKRILAQADESQFYRIDHFLGKETVESILAIRFGNRIYEPVWRAEHIDHIEITAAETIGVEERGSFYEHTGALRDMVPNHLFQLLCMTAIEPPAHMDAELFRDEKVKLMKSVRPISAADAVRGQYDSGNVHGEKAKAYRDEPKVARGSFTETFVAAKLLIDTPRWRGVPFYLRTGKRLTARKTEIVITFRRVAQSPFVAGTRPAPDILRLEIEPCRGWWTSFSAKVPGPAMQLRSVTTGFRYEDIFQEPPNVGYETLLYDCMQGDATLFQRADYIEATWAVVDPLLKAWTTGAPDLYAAGSAGPAAADDLLARDGRHWSALDTQT